MQVYKFGGASVKDAAGVRNVLTILNLNEALPKVVVISAMGKMTNALERVVHAFFYDQNSLFTHIDYIKDYHDTICEELFDYTHPIHEKIEGYVADLETFLALNHTKDFAFVYDAVVSYGELLSTTIVSAYLTQNHLENTWLDARDLIKTDSTYRDAKVDWTATQTQIANKINPTELTLTQGFIAGALDSTTTTLGREGSDYSAGIIAYCLNAERVLIWKDVEGILNADPREFLGATLLKHISYQEAIELAFYGASVIHPKTIQPLQQKEIPLSVKSFLNPHQNGTEVSKGAEISPKTPCFIVKKDLTLLSISTTDFSFFVEDNISEVFALFHQYQVKVHLIQNSAISFSVCIEDKFDHQEDLINLLRNRFKVSYNENVTLFTIRHITPAAVNQIRANKTILLEQHTRGTVQFVTKN